MFIDGLQGVIADVPKPETQCYPTNHFPDEEADQFHARSGDVCRAVHAGKRRKRYQPKEDHDANAVVEQRLPSDLRFEACRRAQLAEQSHDGDRIGGGNQRAEDHPPEQRNRHPQRSKRRPREHTDDGGGDDDAKR